MTYLGPVHVLLCTTLVLGVSCLYLMAIFLPVYASQGWPVAAAHLALGSVLLGNIIFNYTLCIITHPGTTAKSVREVGASQASSLDHGLKMGHPPVNQRWTFSPGSTKVQVDGTGYGEPR